jgi:hypothetical protein
MKSVTSIAGINQQLRLAANGVARTLRLGELPPFSPGAFMMMAATA